MLDDLKMIHHRDTRDALGAAERRAGIDVTAWIAVSPAAGNLAKQIALECLGKSVVIYASPELTTAAAAWKKGFNIYAKQLVWTAVMDQAHEHELAGWTKQPVDKPYAVIELRNAATAQRFEVAERLLSGLRPAPIIVEVQGSNTQEQLAWATALGDFVTIYVALLNGVDPSATEFLDKYKQALET